MASDDNRTKLVVAHGSEEAAGALKELAERFERGELGDDRCVAVRLFLADGTWEDRVIGSSDPEDEAAALAALRAAYSDQCH